ncbi:hypothetical protein Ancab_016378 [Ancistrocladus abbreviatus]
MSATSATAVGFLAGYCAQLQKLSIPVGVQGAILVFDHLKHFHFDESCSPKVRIYRSTRSGWKHTDIQGIEERVDQFLWVSMFRLCMEMSVKGL